MKKRKTFGISIGASSIMVIIVILTLVCFAGLTLSSANADYRLCLKLADRTRAYYQATSNAYSDIKKSKESSLDENPFDDSYPINENQVLKVSAIINPSMNCNYELKTFKIMTVKEPELDDSLSLLLH